MLSVEGEHGSWVGMVDAHHGTCPLLLRRRPLRAGQGRRAPGVAGRDLPQRLRAAQLPDALRQRRPSEAPRPSRRTPWACSPAAPEGPSAVTHARRAPPSGISDACGAVNETTTCDADIHSGASQPTDTNCTSPRATAPGTPRPRAPASGRPNRQKEHAGRGSPANTWLTAVADPGQLQRRQHLQCELDGAASSSTCSGPPRPVLAAATTPARVAGVVQHEWGHGMDENDGGGFDNPSEAYADVSEFLADHTSCIGRGFYMGQTCSGYGDTCLTCTGIRDMDWDTRTRHTPRHRHRREPDRQSCPAAAAPAARKSTARATSSARPSTTSPPATSRPSRLRRRDVLVLLTDRLWYTVPRLGSGGHMYTCTAGAGGCAATSVFARMRAVDDDDGNLANGTPHAAAIFAAFARHGIACGAASDASNQSTAFPPVLTALSLSGTRVHQLGDPDHQPHAAGAGLRGQLPHPAQRHLLRLRLHAGGHGAGSTTTYTDTGLAQRLPALLPRAGRWGRTRRTRARSPTA